MASNASVNQAGSGSSSPSDSPAEEEEKDTYYLPYDHEYWDDKDVTDVEDVVSVPESGAGNNTTTEMGSESLLAANNELAVNLLPVIVLLALVLVLTLLANTLVCVVYRTRFRRNSINLFVVFLAGLEMVLVCVGAPMEMAVLALPLMFNSPVACKLVRYMETFSVCLVLLVLTAIAVDRYCKMTRPANFLSQKWVKGLFTAAIVLAVFLAAPALFLFGSKTVPTQIEGVDGVACDVDDAMRSSPVRIIYIVLLLLTFVVALVTKTVLYILMFVRIVRRRSANRGEKVSPARREYPRKHRFVTEDSISSCGGEETRRLPTSSSGSGSSGFAGPTSARSGRTSPGVDPARVPLKSGVKESARIGQGASTTVDVQSTRMTWIFFIVSVVTVITILPFMVTRTLRVFTSLLDTLQPVVLPIVCQLCVKLYLLHPPLIPLIYLCCNHNFRREAKHLLQGTCLRCKRQPPTSNGNSSSHAHR